MGLILGLMVMGSPAQAGDRGVLRIVTEPGNAQIYINGQRKGNSPSDPNQLFSIQLDEGSYQVEAVKPLGNGMEDFTRSDDVFVADGTVQTLTLKLDRRRQAAPSLPEVNPTYNGQRIAPDMVRIPGGTFRMGCLGGGGPFDCREEELPVHQVTIASFEMGAREVTFDEWDICVADGGCAHKPQDRGWGRGNRPVINVSLPQIQSYLSWLNEKTGKTYRLPSEAEWEYAARAGTETAYSWGNKIGTGNANCRGCGSPWGDKQTAPVGSFRPNRFGLYDMNGNVYERLADCWHDNYSGAPSTGQAWTTGDCSYGVVRGGSWFTNPKALRSAARNKATPGAWGSDSGFRIARTVTW